WNWISARYTCSRSAATRRRTICATTAPTGSTATSRRALDGHGSSGPGRSRPDLPLFPLSWEASAMTNALTAGQRVTLLKIDEGLAMTHRHELEVRQVLTPERVGFEGRYQRLAVVRRRGRRKDAYLDLAADDILLDGWGLPFCADTEAGGVIAGNACYKLVGDPQTLPAVIQGPAVVPLTAAAT